MSYTGCQMGGWDGRIVHDLCDDCGHMLLIHRPDDSMCAACQMIDETTELRATVKRLEQRLDGLCEVNELWDGS